MTTGNTEESKLPGDTQYEQEVSYEKAKSKQFCFDNG
jgi:hypothetical protein